VLVLGCCVGAVLDEEPCNIDMTVVRWPQSLTVKPLANGGIGDTETIPASSIPRLVSLSVPVVLVLAPCLDPSNSCLAIASATRRFPLSFPPPPSSTFHLSRYPLRRAAPFCLQVPSDLNIKLVSFPLRAFACARARYSRFLLFSVYGLLTILLLALFPPRLPAVVASRFPFVAPPFSFSVLSSRPVLSAACSHHRLRPFLLPMSFILSTNSPLLCSAFLVGLHFQSTFSDGLLLYSLSLSCI